VIGIRVEWYIPALGTPVVALADYGLSLNLAAYKTLAEPTGVRLGFDRNRRWIVIKPLQGTEDEVRLQEGLPVRGRDGSVRVNGRDFTRFVHRYYPELRPGNRAVRYLAWQSEDDGLLVVDLNQPVEMGRGNDGTDDDGETENQH
jgi:hypothetical protein